MTVTRRRRWKEAEEMIGDPLERVGVPPVGLLDAGGVGVVGDLAPRHVPLAEPAAQGEAASIDDDGALAEGDGEAGEEGEAGEGERDGAAAQLEGEREGSGRDDQDRQHDSQPPRRSKLDHSAEILWHAGGVTPVELLRAVWRAALTEAAPGPRVAAALDELPAEWAARPRYVISVGKAASAMLAGAAAGGWVRAVAVGPAEEMARWRSGEAGAAITPSAASLGPVLALDGSHPLPDEASVAAARALEALVAAAPRSALILALVSGGGSAMVARPRDGVTLEDKVAATRRTMASGASIAELNSVRRSLSAVKGGQLVEGAAAPVLSLLVSDVAGDDPRTIASGLTISTAARSFIEEWALPDELEGSARRGDRYAVLAGQDAVARAVAEELAARRWTVERRGEPLVGDVGGAAEELARSARWACEQGRRAAIVAYGEPTVRLPSAGGSSGASGAMAQGGRAQQLALLLAAKLEGLPVTALVAGSDGVDGPSQPPVAGAIVDGRSWSALRARGVDGADAIARCDARRALAAIDALLLTGATGLNHADAMILLCEPAAA